MRGVLGEALEVNCSDISPSQRSVYKTNSSGRCLNSQPL